MNTYVQPWWVDTPLTLRTGVETILGADGRNMLVTPEGRYIALSSSAARLVRSFDVDTTGATVAARIGAEPGSGPFNTLGTFLVELRQANVLTVPPDEAQSRQERLIRVAGKDPAHRWPLLSRPTDHLVQVGAWLRRVPWQLYAVVAALATGSGVAAGPVLLFGTHTFGEHFGPAVAIAVPLLVLEICVHESCHALALAYTQTPSRSAGVGLLLWLIPIAYVDRSDIYRCTSRWRRSAVSLAGPVCDGTFVAFAAVVHFSTSGMTSATALYFGVFLWLSLVANLNPLLPTDGYHALEAAAASINLRGRANRYVLHRLMRRPLPTYLAKTTRRVRAGYIVFAAVSGLYLLLILVVVVLRLGYLVVSAVSWL